MSYSSGRNRTRVYVYRNEACAEGKVLIYSAEDMTLAALKLQAGEKLGIKVQRVFLSSGAEVKSEDQIQNEDNLYFSAGEPFYRSSSAANEKMDIAILGAGGVGKSAIAWRYLRDRFIERWEPTIQDVYTKTVRVDGELSVLELLDTAGQEDFESMRSQWMMDKDGYMFVYSLTDPASVRQLYAFVDLLSQVCDGFDRAPPVVFIGNKKDIVDSDSVNHQRVLEDVRHVIEAYEEASRSLDRRDNRHHVGGSRVPSLGTAGSHDPANTSMSFNSSFQAAALFDQSMNDDKDTTELEGLSPWMESLHFETSAFSGENVEDAFKALVRDIRNQRRNLHQRTDVTAPKPKSIFSWCTLL